MILAGMVSLDEEALICDFAETYHIYNWRALPVRMAATLAAGLRENSRIKRKARGETASQETILLAMITDRLGDLLFSGGVYQKRPDSIAMAMLEKTEQKPAGDVKSFRTFDELMAARAKFIGGN